MAKRQTSDSAQTDGDTTPTIETSEETAARLAGKGHATPTRKEQEAARRRPLVPNDRKEAARQSRSKSAEQREKARLGMAAGDDRYLTARDKGPQRRFVRDYVDARFNIGELMIPVMLLVIVLSFTPITAFQVYGILVLWAFFIVALIDDFILAYIVRKRLAQKFGEGKVERGVRWYAGMRAMQLRMIRLPKPQVKRRQFPS
ncbi:DUF3043 domain-containing protein [Microbacterium sp. STN6]|uniref:DUF3043 domain-containing protein n=1 Tax=Microbacterium sp. STN6 TaxID=2995588 RepID=UPI002260B23D|nr:DUF3043 domain-containing protein [Microbacterium sp. STN6]MCX7521527.1 DUF3043 domain-containing protein [Microbacterium sp. STN6]